MSYPLRLPAALDAQARERCAAIGISLNALVCVALDAYLRAGVASPPAAGVPPPAGPTAKRQKHLARAKAAGVPEGFEDIFDPDEYADLVDPTSRDPNDEELDQWIATGKQPESLGKAKPPKRKK